MNVQLTLRNVQLHQQRTRIAPKTPNPLENRVSSAEGTFHKNRQKNLGELIQLEKSRIQTLLHKNPQLRPKFAKKAAALGVDFAEEREPTALSKFSKKEPLALVDKKKPFRRKSRKLDSKCHSRTFSDNLKDFYNLNYKNIKRMRHRRKNCMVKIRNKRKQPSNEEPQLTAATNSNGSRHELCSSGLHKTTHMRARLVKSKNPSLEKAKTIRKNHSKEKTGRGSGLTEVSSYFKPKFAQRSMAWKFKRIKRPHFSMTDMMTRELMSEHVGSERPQAVYSQKTESQRSQAHLARLPQKPSTGQNSKKKINFSDDGMIKSGEASERVQPGKESWHRRLGTKEKSCGTEIFGSNGEFECNMKWQAHETKQTKPKSGFVRQSEDSERIFKGSSEDGHGKEDSGRCEEIIETLGKADESAFATCMKTTVGSARTRRFQC